ncbi:MAG: cadherin-like beta sandwich domain-containing protein, partial [Prolixibacteraceae bacterium]|nr:cadherin-like beta sandwich domain-containing protein [Prolixibacteraceae bacterium]
MKTFTLKFLVMVCAFVVSGMTMGHAQEWNISSDNFNALGDIVETTTVDGLTIYASAEKDVTIDDNNKSVDGMDFSFRLKLGGSGSLSDGVAETRVLAFDVAGNTNISVAAMSSNSDNDRELIVVNATSGDTIGTHAALGAELTMSTFQYEGDATSIYMYSPSSGVNIYYIKVAAPQLETLAASAGAMTPEFDPEKTAYQVNLPAGTTTFGLTATAAEGVEVNVPDDLTVADGGNYEMTVTASDGVATAYAVNVHVQADGEILYVSSSDGVYSVARAFDTNVYDALVAAGYSVTFASKRILTEEGFDYSPYAGMVLSGGMGSSRANGVAQNAYPIPCVSMQNDGPKNNKWGWVNDNNAEEYATTKSYDASNVQFKILNNEHPITSGYEVDQMITWTNGTAESDDFLGKEIKYYNLTDSIPEAVALATIPGNDGQTMPTMWAVPKGTSVRSLQLDGSGYARTETASNVVLMYLFNDGLLYAAPGFDELLTKSLAWAIDGDDACVFEPFYAGIENLTPDPEGADISLWDGWGLKSIVTGSEAYCGPSSILLEDLMGGEGCGWPDRSAAMDVAAFEWMPNTTYHLRAMVKTIDGPIGFLAKGSVDNGGGDFGFGLDTQGEWMQLDTTFTTSATPVEGFFSFNTCDFNSTATKTYIDNYELYALPSTVKVAYVTDFSNLTAVGASDPIVAMLEADENIDLTVIEHDADDTDGPLDLSAYDAVVAQEAFGSSSTIYQRGQT